MSLLGTKIGSLFIIFILTIICGLSPIKVAQLCTGKKGQLILSLLHCFAGGVFLGTFLLHLFPEVLENVMNQMASAQEAFPVAESLVAGGFFLILTMEQIVMLLSKMRNDNLAEALKGEPSLLKEEQANNTEEISSLTNPVKNVDSGTPGKPTYGALEEDIGNSEEGTHVHKTRAAVLVFALTLHSIFEGLALGLQNKQVLVWSLMAAIATHKMVMAFSVGLQLTSAFRSTQKLVIICMLIFASVSPLGIAIGTIITETPHSNTLLAKMSSALEGIATGSFLYVSFFEILVPELRNRGSSLLKVLFIFIGFMCMAGLRLLHPHHN